jgi:hypothetical protein
LHAAGIDSRRALRSFSDGSTVVTAGGTSKGRCKRSHPIMGVMEHNTADMGLHFAIAAVALYFGFAGRRDGNDARG